MKITSQDSQVKQMTVRIPKDAWKRLKIGLLQQEISFQDWLVQAVDEAFPSPLDRSLKRLEKVTASHKKTRMT